MKCFLIYLERLCQKKKTSAERVMQLRSGVSVLQRDHMMLLMSGQGPDEAGLHHQALRGGLNQALKVDHKLTIYQFNAVYPRLRTPRFPQAPERIIKMSSALRQGQTTGLYSERSHPHSSLATQKQ